MNDVLDLFEEWAIMAECIGDENAFYYVQKKYKFSNVVKQLEFKLENIGVVIF